MSVDNFLSKLEKVRTLGPGRWMARCPAHEDRTASLSITDDNGLVKIYCHALCSFGDVIGAVGVDASEMFPPRPIGAEFRPPQRKLIDAEAALKALEPELTIAVIAVSDSRQGRPVCDADHKRFLLAIDRLMAAIALAKERPLTEYEIKKLTESALSQQEERDLEAFINE